MGRRTLTTIASRSRVLALAALVAALGGVLLTAPSPARAGGFDYVGQGTRALGRGGAFMARADDPMALAYNPAALAFLPGYQLMLGSHLGFYDACVERTGTYNDSNVSDNWFYESRFGPADAFDQNNWVNQPFPRVCRSGFPGPSPALIFTGHPIPELGFGIGVLAPSAVGNGTWGNSDGTIDVDGRSLPSPTRYALVDQNLLLFHPTIGVGFSPVPEFSLGVSFQWGIAIVEFTNHTSSGFGAEDPGDDVRTALHAEDFFVPAVIVSAHVVPVDALDIVAMARVSDGIDAGTTLTLTTGWFGTDRLGSLTPTTSTLTGGRLQAGQPWQFGLAVRYADRRERRFRDPEQAGRVTGRVEDHMQNEVWDIELDVVYQHNGTVADFVATPPAGATARLCEPTDDDPNTECTPLDAPLPGSLPIPHGWRDQVSVRLGADWNILPGTFAARLGAHFESTGITARYLTQDFMPGTRLGLHAGLTLRIDRFDVSIAYAHVFQFDKTVTNGDFRMISAQGTEGQCEGAGGAVYDPAQPVTSRGCYPQGAGSIVNNGRYTADYNVLSLQVSYNFQ